MNAICRAGDVRDGGADAPASRAGGGRPVSVVLAPTCARTDWVDAAKGLGILLVVVGHVIGGMHDAGMLSADDALVTLNYFIYVFHMPLFFLLSGLFVPRRVEANPRQFLVGSVRRLVVPYFLWSVIQLGVIHLAGNAVNKPTPLEAGRLVALLWQPTSQYWYLHALVLMHVAAALFYRRLGESGLFLGALVALGVKGLFDPPEVLANFCRFFAFYATGVALGARIQRKELHEISFGFTVCAAVCWLMLAQAALRRGAGYWDVAAAPAAALGTIAWLGLSQRAQVRHAAVLRYLGRHSMPIFLAHVIFSAGARVTFAELAPWGHGLPLFVLAVACGVVGPVFVYEVAKRVRLANVMGFN
jgi:fucose 4-O-acetylase-like acetyltransferase